MASPNRRGTGKDEGRKKRRDAGEAQDAEQEESAAAGSEDTPAEPEAAPRPPRLYGYDPDQWPEPN
jgi:hypothetical protein